MAALLVVIVVGRITHTPIYKKTAAFYLMITFRRGYHAMFFSCFVSYLGNTFLFVLSLRRLVWRIVFPVWSTNHSFKKTIGLRLLYFYLVLSIFEIKDKLNLSFLFTSFFLFFLLSNILFSFLFKLWFFFVFFFIHSNFSFVFFIWI